jgi:hypothetical protein
MTGRVSKQKGLSESVMVRVRYCRFTEEHPRVSNRNLMKVDLDVSRTLKRIGIDDSVPMKESYELIRVAPRIQPSSLNENLRMRVFCIHKEPQENCKY